MSSAVNETREKDWLNISFFTLTPVIGIVGTAVYTWRVGLEWWMPALFLLLYAATGISITAGYHRYFSHKTYECHPVVQAFYAFFGAFAAQNSILWWSAGHRNHHKHVDTDWDPYSINRGFWWAHIIWLFYKSPQSGYTNVPDLEKNRIVMWQRKYTKAILILGGFGIPTAIGALFGHPLGGLLWGGFLRLVILHQTTFFVNSLAHTFGAKSYSADLSARDNWMVALVTFGEGYHSFHHRFPGDFRNGILWYQWDPSKWLLHGLKAVGLASDLVAVAPPLIEAARLEAAVVKVESQLALAPPTMSEEVRQRIASARARLEHAFALWRQHAQERAEGLKDRWKTTRRNSRRQIRHARKEWRTAMRMLSRLPNAA